MKSQHQRFAALLDEHRGIVHKVAHAWCSHPEDRRDLAQEIAAQLWRAFPRYDSTRSFSTWMYRVALNVAISYARGADARPAQVPLEEHHRDGLSARDGAEREEQDERLRALETVIAAQPPLDRALLLLWLEERSQREIAEVLGLSETNVSTRLGRLKERIRKQVVGGATS